MILRQFASIAGCVWGVMSAPKSKLKRPVDRRNVDENLTSLLQNKLDLSEVKL